VSSDPITTTQALGSDLVLLTDLSTIHKDGWGGAFLNSVGSISLERDTAPAHESDLYKQVIDEFSTTCGMIHLRWATGNYQVCVENTHPFMNGSMAFEHNGGFENATALEDLIDSDLIKSREGETDSEWYFLYLQTLIRSEGSIEAAYRKLIPVMQKLCPYSSLNSMIVTPEYLYVVSAHNPERLPEGLESDYYHLSWDQDSGFTTAWSSGVRARGGQPLVNYHVLRVSISTQECVISPIT
jgi:predicted glutamine amidotransferase